MALLVTLGQHFVPLPPLLTSRDTRGVDLTNVLQQEPWSHMASQAYATYVMGPPQVSSFFSVKPPTNLLIYVDVCYVVCFTLSGAILDAIFTNGGSTIGVCTTAYFHGRHMCILVMVIGPCKKCTGWLCPTLLWVWGALCYSACCSPAIWWTYSFGGLAEGLCLPYMVGRGLLFQVWFHPMS